MKTITQRLQLSALAILALGRSQITAVTLEPLPLMDSVKVGDIEFQAKALPKGLVLHPEMGLLTVDAVKGQVVHRTKTRILETRATITPKGDFLLMFAEGDHYAKSKGEKINTRPARCRRMKATQPLNDSSAVMMVVKMSGDLDDKAENMKVRSEIWVSTSTDEGHTWSEPRFVLANAVAPVHKVAGFNSQCSYLDAFTENGVMHLFMPHRWQQALHLTIKEDAFSKLPTREQLKAAARN